MPSRIKPAIFTFLIALAIAIVASPRETRAALSFDIAGAPLSSATAVLGPSLCWGCSVSTTLNAALDSIAFTLNPG